MAATKSIAGKSPNSLWTDDASSSGSGSSTAKKMATIYVCGSIAKINLFESIATMYLRDLKVEGMDRAKHDPLTSCWSWARLLSVGRVSWPD